MSGKIVVEANIAGVFTPRMAVTRLAEPTEAQKEDLEAG